MLKLEIYKFLLMAIYCFSITHIIDIIHFIFLKYIIKDKHIQNVDFKFLNGWWHFYFTNKYKKNREGS